MSLDPMDGALRRYRTLLLLWVPAGLLIGGAAAWWMAGFSLLPLLRLAEAAHQIDLKTLERRLPVRGVDDELDKVALAFNEALGRLEHAVGEMRQFSAALAHELRTPLAALRGEIELSLRAAGTSQVLEKTLASQIEEIDRLTKLIDHILTLARAESGQIRLQFAPVDVSQLAASLAEQLEPLAEARSIDMKCEASGEVVVDADSGWLQRLLLNLLDNALKFTNPNGRIVIRVSREGDAARIDVQDTGIGLSPDDAGRVFERFFRADPARSSSVEGAGLGLSLVQWIAEQHGGQVTVDSRPGAGSTFSVILPLVHVEQT
jgi:heavy metal sensor kinase